MKKQAICGTPALQKQEEELKKQQIAALKLARRLALDSILRGKGGPPKNMYVLHLYAGLVDILDAAVQELQSTEGAGPAWELLNKFRETGEMVVETGPYPEDGVEF